MTLAAIRQAFACVLAALALLTAASLSDAAAEQPGGGSGADSTTYAPQPSSSTGKIHLKFVEGSSVRLRGGGFASLGPDDLKSVREALRNFPGAQIRRLFTRPEAALAADHARLEATLEEEVPDLNLWYRLALREATDASALVQALTALPIVQAAYEEPFPRHPPDRRWTLLTSNRCKAT